MLLIQIKSIIKSFNLFYNTFYLFADFDFTNNFYLYYNAQVLNYALDVRARKVISVIIPNEPKTGCDLYLFYKYKSSINL
jgi:hypothetical protein